MSVRVVARIRPLQSAEREADVILHTASSPSSSRTAPGGYSDNLVKIPIPKNESQEYSFQFHSVYGPDVTQEELFDAEIAPTIKHLFAGFDVTVFAYGVTGTGKTHTMRGGESPESRGVIPRLLSGMHKYARRMEKESNHEVNVELLMSYYEIYNDKVFDLFEDPDKKTPLGLPLREAGGGKTVVVGLTERQCSNLKEFETMYDQANENRSTGATKLNAHSSRSHAILCVKVVVTTADTRRVSTVSAIDLAGSEDNRRTENGKERMVESASINRSLFVLAQCVEAISKQQARIPYRESKMTRILSLGQNKGRTVMILNLAPTRSYYLDTLSSLNFANRTKKIEVRDVENEFTAKNGSAQKKPSYLVQKKASSSSAKKASSSTPKKVSSPSPKKASPNSLVGRQSFKPTPAPKAVQLPVRSFSDSNERVPPRLNANTSETLPNTAAKMTRLSGSKLPRTPTRAKTPTPQSTKIHKSTSKDNSSSRVDASVEERVEAAIASRLKELDTVNDSLRRQLREVERRVEEMEYTRTEGLLFLLMAKQHHARGEDTAALRLYLMALPFFPRNEKLKDKIAKLRRKLGEKSIAVEQQLYGRRKAMAQTTDVTLDSNGNSSIQQSKIYESLMMQAKAMQANAEGQLTDEYLATQLQQFPKELLGEHVPPEIREGQISAINLGDEGSSDLSLPGTADCHSFGNSSDFEFNEPTTYSCPDHGEIF